MGSRLLSFLKKPVFVMAVLMLLGFVIEGQAVTATVDCSNPKAKVKTIAAGLAALPTTGSNTLLVSGTCVENVRVENFTSLIVQGNPSATIDGSGNPAAAALYIFNSSFVRVDSITVDGGAGTECAGASICNFHNGTFQNSSGAGVVIGLKTGGLIRASTIQNNPNQNGVRVEEGGQVAIFGSTIQGNGGNCGMNCGGIFAGGASSLRVLADGATPTVIQNNPFGIRAMHNATVHVQRTTITGNGGDGIQLLLGSIARVGGLVSITGNGLRGVRIGDMSLASFENSGGFNTISGNSGGAEQIWCDGQNAATRGAPLIDPSTNCPAEPPLVP